MRIPYIGNANTNNSCKKALPVFQGRAFKKTTNQTTNYIPISKLSLPSLSSPFALLAACR